MPKKQENFTLLDGRVTMAPSLYNPTSDAVWLAAFVPSNVKTVLDVGIGSGGVSLCLLQHISNAHIKGIDISEEMLSACRKNIELNNCNDRICVSNTDIFNWSTTELFDAVITNPPYFQGTPAKHNAHHNTDITQWTKKSLARVKSNGFFCTIVDTQVADKVIAVLCDKHLGDIKIFPLFSTKNSAERVLIRGRKGVSTGTTIYRGSPMNNDQILRSGLTIESLLTTLESL